MMKSVASLVVRCEILSGKGRVMPTWFQRASSMMSPVHIFVCTYMYVTSNEMENARKPAFKVITSYLALAYRWVLET